MTSTTTNNTNNNNNFKQPKEKLNEKKNENAVYDQNEDEESIILIGSEVSLQKERLITSAPSPTPHYNTEKHFDSNTQQSLTQKVCI
jgi:hypothetical protein